MVWAKEELSIHTPGGDVVHLFWIIKSESPAHVFLSAVFLKSCLKNEGRGGEVDFMDAMDRNGQWTKWTGRAGFK